MHIHDLPDEVLMLILDYIEPWELRRGAVGACRRWALVVRQRAPAVRAARELRALRRGLRALLVPAGLAPFHVPTLLTRAAQLSPNLAALTLHAGVRFSLKEFTILQYLLPNLRHLDVFFAPHTPTPSFLLRLQSIVFNQETVYSDRSYDLSESRLRALHMYGESQHFPSRLVVLRACRDHLTELTLRCTKMQDNTFQAVGDCVNLEILQLYSCWLMRGAGAAAVTRPPRLRRLHVTGAVLVRRGALSEALATLPLGLEELAISGGCFGDEHVAVLTARLPHLATLEAWNCPLSATGVLRLAAALPQLRVLDLNLALVAHQVAALTRHPTLEFLRYLPENTKADRLELRNEESSKEESSGLSGPSPSDTAMSAEENLFNESSETKGLERAGEATSQDSQGMEEEAATATLTGAPRALRAESAAAAFAEDYFRPSGAGFRGRLFYYWTPPLQLRHKHAPLRDGDFDF